MLALLVGAILALGAVAGLGFLTDLSRSPSASVPGGHRADGA